ncbi:MAG TPA: hypothetical protein VGO60_16095 [Iamia sp.]|jgi:hypothetical protein|nr:hypothetical protein [Iamia sp.]
MPRRIALIASSLALAVVLVGCGSSDDDSSDDGGDATTTVEESTTEATTEAGTEETTAPDDSTEPTETTEAPDETTTTPGGSGEVDEEFCAAYAAFDESADELPDETVEDIQAGGQVLLDGIQSVQEVAPDELAEDLGTLVDAVEQLVAAMADATTVEEARDASTGIFDNEEFQGAASRVDSYFDGCPQADDDQANEGAAEPPTTAAG